MRKGNIRKNCVGCWDIFYCSPTENYHYCKSCELNESLCLKQIRGVGDGCGVVRFVGQVARRCKICYLDRISYLYGGEN